MKKKKGSSLIFVLVTLMVMVTFGFSILSLTLMSYKKRFTEANEKRNQYFSEAGIDIAYGIIGKTVDQAMAEGNNAVNDAIEKINQAAKSELSDDDNKKYQAYLNADGSLNKDKINKEIFLPAYKNYIEQNLAPNILDRSLYDVGESKNGNAYDKPIVTIVDRSGSELSGEEENPKGVKLSFIDDGDNNNDTLSIHLKSEFSSNKTSDNVNSGQIHKIISVNYVIGPSKYSKPITQKVQAVEVPTSPVWQKIICTDSNFIVKSDMTIKGDIYSKGTDNGGIDIQGGNFNVSGIIGTCSNFLVSGSFRQAAIALNGNLYAENISLTGDNTVFNLNPYSDRNLLGAIYTNNDFEIFGNGGNVNINGSFYGVNDKTEKTTYPGQSKPPVSSCVLINADNPPNFKINNQAVLMGVGYVKTNPQYETGESVAIKGNYKAYTKALNNEKFNDQKVVFEYMPPLTLAKGLYQDDGSVKELVFQDKSEYIKAYDEENNDLNKSNVSLNTNGSNIISVGTFISDGKMYNNNYKVDFEGFIRNKKAKYSKVVYGMQYVSDDSADDNFNGTYPDNPDGLDNYQNNLVNNTDNNITVAKEIDFTKISSHVNKIVKHIGSGDTNIIYLDGDGSSDCYLIGQNGVKPSGQDANVIDLDKDNIKGGVIITKGKVHIRGTISDFKGTIISEGDITDEDGKNPKNFTYDENYIREIIGNNADNFNGLFNSSSPDKNIYTSTSSDNSSVGTDVIRDASQIKMLNWRIIK